MTDNPGPTVIPMIAYEDGCAAMDWLVKAFGFTERARMVNDDGRLTHGELEFDGGIVMLATPTPDYRSPKHHRETCDQAKAWSAVPWIIDGVMVYVGDVDAHYALAVSCGATILSEPEDGYPGRRYRAEDLEGHRWFFIQRP